ncbi:MAG: Hpt domain-containing protein [Anaerotignum sp.]
MTIKECYEAFGGNYAETMGRMGSERLVQKFALKFLTDSSFDTLCETMEKADCQEAFRAAHTLKGICLNLGFDPLGKISGQLTEALRPCQPECLQAAETAAMLEQVKQEYGKVKALLEQVDA